MNVTVLVGGVGGARFLSGLRRLLDISPGTTRDEVPIPPLNPNATVPVPAPTEPSGTAPPRAPSSASSTSGGTNELIELAGPADGSYTLYVHGWQTFGEQIELAVRSWAVPATPGTGALSIVSAPAEAVLGTTGTIVVEWSGLEPEETYLGAVSHSNAEGAIGLTLVEIATGP